MSQVIVELNGRSYRLRCEDGDEKRLLQLGSVLSKKIDHLKKEIGNVGEERLFVMSALMIVDEMLDLRKEVRELKKQLRGAAFIDSPQQDQDEDPGSEAAPDLKIQDMDVSSETLADHYSEEDGSIPEIPEIGISEVQILSPEHEILSDQKPSTSRDGVRNNSSTFLHPAAALINSPLLHSKLNSTSMKALEKAHQLSSSQDHGNQRLDIKTGAELARELKEKFLKD